METSSWRRSRPEARIAKEQDVAIDVAEKIMAGEFLGAIVDAGKIFCAVVARADFRNMANPEFSADFGGARIVAEQKNFYVRMDALPTAQCIALDRADVTAKGLRGGASTPKSSTLLHRFA